MRKVSVHAFGVLLLSLVLSASVVSAGTLRVLSVSDWHGQLDPTTLGSAQVGGAAVLSAYFERERLGVDGSLTLTSGDAWGATPPLSAFFGDVPTVLAMNEMGFDADTLGNHNFDAGIAALQDLLDLAEFPFVCANLLRENQNLKHIKRVRIVEVAGVKVALIGVLTPDTPSLVFPGRMGTIEVTDMALAAQRARDGAAEEGAQVFIALAHEGVWGYDADGQAFGPLLDFAQQVHGFDLILGDHTNVEFAAEVNGALVIENRSKGVTYARIDLELDEAGVITDRDFQFVVPYVGGVTPDPDVVALLEPYRALLSAAYDRVIGVATDVFVRGSNIERLKEVPLGNLVADAIRVRYGTQLGFTNGGGLRAPLPSSYLPADHTLRRTTPGYAAGPPYDLVVGDVFAVLPFGNVVVTRTVTGAQLWAALENSVAVLPGANGRFAQISGFRFGYDLCRPMGSRVKWVQLDDGTPILADGTPYTFATNDFVNTGGDGYTMLADGQGTTREVMADVVLEHIEALGTIRPTVEGRIQNVTPASCF